ncbi:MAG: hypothetical protein GY750_20875 [Lentisphaerae bacterium]|nr:hypothetical protein [Lentisphaerota bacterium]
MIDIQILIEQKEREVDTYSEAIEEAKRIHADYIGSLERALGSAQLHLVRLTRMRTEDNDD